MNFAVVFKVSGTLNLLLSCLLLLPLLWCFWFETNERLGFHFITSSGLMAVIGLIFRRLGKGAPQILMPRDALGIVAYSWVALAITGALPYWVSGTMPTFADAVFESVSGFTTTGSTILTDIEALPKALLFWRSLTQWVGGLGVVVLFVSIFPSLGVGGKSLFKMEVPGPITENVTPKIRDTSRNLWYTYLFLTVLQTLLLWQLGGVSLFDSLTHSFTTAATGGFSTKNASVAHFDSATVEWIIIVFMFLGGTNFGLYYLMTQGQLKAIFKDTELRFYAFVTLMASLAIAFMLWWNNGYQIDDEAWKNLQQHITSPAIFEKIEPLRNQKFHNEAAFSRALMSVGLTIDNELSHRILEEANQNYDLHRAIRSALFQVIALITTTGFASDDYEGYPVATHMIIFYLLFTGGCAGSTAGGVKLFRIVLVGKTLFHEIQMSFRPSLVSKIRVGNTIISSDLIRTVLAFFGVYIAFVSVGALLLGLEGHDMLTSMTASMTAVGNFGPGFGTVGPTENFAHFSSEAKYLLAILMLLGRLEFFTLLGVFHRRFWKR